MCKGISVEDTFNNPNEDTRPVETDVIELTDDMYDELFWSGSQPETPWYVVFVRTDRTSDQFWQSTFVVNVMKIMADEYAGKVRFAYVDTAKSPRMKHTFHIKVLPQSYLFKDGHVYMTKMMAILVNQVRTFIDERHLDDQYRFDDFPTSRLIPGWAIPMKRDTYDKVWQWYWSDGGRGKVQNWLRNTKVPYTEDKSIMELGDPYVKDFFNFRPYKQINAICAAAILTALALLISVVKLLSCTVRCLCCRKKADGKAKTSAEKSGEKSTDKAAAAKTAEGPKQDPKEKKDQ